MPERSFPPILFLYVLVEELGSKSLLTNFFGVIGETSSFFEDSRAPKTIPIYWLILSKSNPNRPFDSSYSAGFF
jgi:hypothetical protein